MNEEKLKEMAKPNKVGRAREFLQQGREDEVYGDNEYYRKGFLDGGLYADKHPKNPWISVKDTLPKKTRELELLEDEHDKVVIVCRRFGEAVTAYLDAEEIWRLYPTGRPFYGAITHWMPIPKLKKE